MSPLLWIAVRNLLYAPSHRQGSRYHGLFCLFAVYVFGVLFVFLCFFDFFNYYYLFFWGGVCGGGVVVFC